jgi:hypothetical protein
MTTPAKTVELMLVTPDTAAKWLAQNADNNRAVKQSQVKLYASYMRKGEWNADNCAITFDAEGNLIDGQHRLQAVVKSGQAQEFIVGRNWPTNSMLTLDMGKGRTFTDRMVVAGTELTAMECDILRNAMTTYTSSQKGTQSFSSFGKEAAVAEQYKRHSEIVKLIAGRYRGKVSKLVLGAAINGYAQACDWVERGKFDEDPSQRILDFLNIVASGGAASCYNPSTDQAAMKLREQITAKKAAGRNWQDMQDFRIGATAVFNFLMKKPQKQAIRPLGKPPFALLADLPGTNI